MVGHDGQMDAAAVKEEHGALLTASWRVGVKVETWEAAQRERWSYSLPRVWCWWPAGCRCGCDDNKLVFSSKTAIAIAMSNKAKRGDGS